MVFNVLNRSLQNRTDKNKVRHAYCLMTHKFDSILATLVRMIDDERNDIYVHIDRKSEDFSRKIYKLVNKSNVFFVHRKTVVWGSIAMVMAEYSLLGFRFAFCPDEMYKQTVFFNAQDRFNLAESNYRLIEWADGGAHPYCFTIDDLPRIVSSGALFCRKIEDADLASQILRLYGVNNTIIKDLI